MEAVEAVEALVGVQLAADSSPVPPPVAGVSEKAVGVEQHTPKPGRY